MEKDLSLDQIEILNHELEKSIQQAILTGKPQDLITAQTLKQQVEQNLIDYKKKLHLFSPEQKEILSDLGFETYLLTKPENLQITISGVTGIHIFKPDLSTHLFNEVAIPQDLYEMSLFDVFSHSGGLPLIDQLKLIPSHAEDLAVQGLKDFKVSLGLIGDYYRLFYHRHQRRGETIPPNTAIRTNSRKDDTKTFAIEKVEYGDSDLVVIDYPDKIISPDIRILPLVTAL